jgi:hypothetical protein
MGHVIRDDELIRFLYGIQMEPGTHWPICPTVRMGRAAADYETQSLLLALAMP